MTLHTFVMLRQLTKDKEVTVNEATLHLGKCVSVAGFDIDKHHFVRQIIFHTAHILSSGKINKQEQCHVLWTSYWNFSIWFDEWEEMMVHLGFVH